MNILKSKKGVLVAATPPVGTRLLVVARVPIDATPPIGATPLATATPSFENTPNMPTNEGFWYNSNEGGGVVTPMEMDEIIGIVGEPSNAGVAIKASIEGKDKEMGK